MITNLETVVMAWKVFIVSPLEYSTGLGIHLHIHTYNSFNIL